MGISIVLEARLPRRNTLSILRQGKDWEVEILDAAKECLREFGQGDLIPAIVDQHHGRLPLHLCEEWPDISVEGNKVFFAARTSTLGPGFHALICTMIDMLHEKIGLNFQETIDSEDETGYFASRDYLALQNYFANWLSSLAELVVENLSEGNSMRLQMPTDQIAPDGKPGEILTPHGPHSVKYFKSILQSSGKDLHLIAAQWFPWWNIRTSSEDYLKMAKQIMWTDIPWRSPETEWEKQTIFAALNTLKRAWLLGADVSSLQPDVVELQRLMTASDEATYSKITTGIGYRKGICRWELTPSWTGLLPGNLNEVSSEDNFQLYNNDFVVRLTSLLVENKSNEFIMSENDGPQKTLDEGAKEKFVWRIERAVERDDKGWLTSIVLAGSIKSLLIATFSHSDDFNKNDLLQFINGLVPILDDTD